MSPKKLDYLNIGLMIGALGLAFIFPFRLFLLSYAILGPLHYLTEINWLKKKNFYTSRNNDWWLLAGLCVLYIIPKTILKVLSWEWVSEDSFLAQLGMAWDQYTNSILFLALTAGVVLVATQKWVIRVAVLVAAGIFSLLVMNVEGYIIAVGMFLPTLVHVYLFTGAFILYGAMKNSSKSGYLSLAVFISCTLILIFLPLNPAWYPVNKALHLQFIDSGFLKITATLAQVFTILETESALTFLTSTVGLKLQVFLSFAYTYHYLNWFSKTSVIRWHDVSRQSLIGIGLAWLVIISIYFFDYALGLSLMLFLSMLHVLMEFPLNYVTFRGIGQEFMKRLGPGSATGKA